ncbi:MAG: hypothetical protein LQ346_001303, partial [Caloplaca aetnensis]
MVSDTSNVDSVVAVPAALLKDFALGDETWCFDAPYKKDVLARSLCIDGSIIIQYSGFQDIVLTGGSLAGK